MKYLKLTCSLRPIQKRNDLYSHARRSHLLREGRCAPTIQFELRIVLILYIGALLTLLQQLIDRVLFQKDLLKPLICHSLVRQQTLILAPGRLLLSVAEEPIIFPLQLRLVEILRVEHRVQAIDFILCIVDQLIVLLNQLKHGPNRILHVILSASLLLLLTIGRLEVATIHLRQSLHSV